MFVGQREENTFTTISAEYDSVEVIDVSDSKSLSDDEVQAGYTDQPSSEPDLHTTTEGPASGVGRAQLLRDRHEESYSTTEGYTHLCTIVL